jgi:hypothetical protein
MSKLGKLVISLVACGGCATAFKAKTTSVNVTSNTPGAEVRVDGKQAGVTPVTVDVSNAADAVITVQSSGHEDTCRVSSSASVGWIAADVLLTGGIGVIVDWATHGWNNVDRNTCHAGV